MAKSPEKKSPEAKQDGFRKRGNPLSDYRDASEPLHPGGFEESPQAELTGTPLTGSISDWADQIAREADTSSQRPRSEQATRRAGGDDKAAKPSKKIPERSSAPTKTARGTSMGGAATARERAAAGLNPVAGLDIALEDAEAMPTIPASPPRSRRCPR